MESGSAAMPDSNEQLPPYLARHMKLGFDDSDVSALIDAITSSQSVDDGDPSLPHIPAEILLHILLAIPPSHILPFRLVCRAFRDIVDTYVFYSYITRTTLRFVLADTQIPPWPYLRRSKAVFGRIVPEMTATGQTDKNRGPAKWDGEMAEFDINYSVQERYPSDPNLRALRDRFAQDRDLPRSTESVDWVQRTLEGLESTSTGVVFTALDNIVNDRPLLNARFDFVAGRITFNWRTMLWGLLREENALRLLMESKVRKIFFYAEPCSLNFSRSMVHLGIHILKTVCDTIASRGGGSCLDNLVPPTVQWNGSST
jgi:hypothetical protein